MRDIKILLKDRLVFEISDNWLIKDRFPDFELPRTNKLVCLNVLIYLAFYKISFHKTFLSMLFTLIASYNTFY